MATPSQTTKIGKYDVIDIIGRGGMGVVYQARDPYLDRLVAIKMMNVDVHENTDFLERFYHEAKSTASLQHPNIVTVYDLGEYQNRPFLVMQYLEGHSLESLLRAHRPMTVLEKIGIIIEVCQGLGYAHQHGIIHRDIKPANIMVLNDGSVKIVDFGIARLGNNTLTRTGQIVGSLYYMPPEQLRDKPVDTRADIYSTGVVLYQLLTYSLPFEGESTGSTLAKIISDDPPPFSQFALKYPQELEAITLKALAKNRDQRFPTAEAFAAALTEVLDGFKQASIQEYLSKAELLQHSNELQQAQEYLLKVLKLDRQHTVASRQLSAIRAKLQAQFSAEQARYLKQQAEEAYARDEFDAALGFTNEAIELDNNPDLQTLRTNIEKAKAEAEIVRKAVARAEAAQRSGDLDSAKSAIDSALLRRPNDSKIRVLCRAIERDLEERERQRQVEGLLDEARKQMSGRKFTAALDLLREAQNLDPSAPQLRTLLERLATEHQQEKQRRELERLNREVQEAIDRDDYKVASARAAEALATFPNEAGLARLKELADTQIEIAVQKEFVRNQTVAAQQLLDSGQTQRALDLVEKALRKVPGNARLESFRTMIQDQMLKERTEADKATCLRQANEAITLGRYPDAIQMLEGAHLRFVDTADVDELLRCARDQQAKARRQAAIEEAMRGAQRLLAEQNFEGAVDLLDKAVNQTPSEDLDVLLLQARDQREGFRREIEAAIAKGRSLLGEGAIANVREFLSSRPASYQQSREFRELLEKAETTPIPALHVDSSAADATLIFAPPVEPASRGTTTERKSGASIFPAAEPEPFVEEPSELSETKLPPPWKRKPLLIGTGAAAAVLVGLVVWLVFRTPQPMEATLNIQARPKAQVLVDGKPVGAADNDGAISIKVSPNESHQLQVTLEGFGPWSGNVTAQSGERKPIIVSLEAILPQPPSPPQPSAKLGTLVLQSNVAGADIFIDRQLKGITGRDNKFRLQLDPGKYRVQAKKSGYQDSPEQRIEIAVNKEKPVALNLVKASEDAPQPPPTDAYLIVQSQAGAEVRVDGADSGKVGGGGTLSVKVAPGARHVQVSLDGYDTWSSNEMVAAGDRKSLEALLKPKVGAPPPLQPRPAATGMFNASQSKIEEGQTTKLIWSTQNASDVSIEPGVGVVSSSGEKDVSPSQTTTYTLSAKGSGGDYASKVEIVVQPKSPPSVSEGSKEGPTGSTGGSIGSSGDVEGIRDALNKFKDIYEGMVAEELRSIWPKITKQQVDAVKRANSGAQSVRLTEDCPGLPKVSGESADWTCHETMTYVARGKRQEPNKSTIFFSFEKAGGKWYIRNRHG
jgi:eukaryotic-like serine/threonine-protein kinase